MLQRCRRFQVCNSRRLIDTLEREMPSESAISSGTKRGRGDIEQGVDLPDGPVDTPPPAHFAESAGQRIERRREVHRVSLCLYSKLKY